jgi:hypothetical protein
MKEFELIPKVGIGAFRIGKHISEYTSVYDYVFYKKNRDDEFSADFYDFWGGRITLYVDEDNIVDDVRTRRCCFYKNKNLIGSKFDDFLKTENYQGRIQTEAIYMLVNGKGQTQKVYDLDDLGLQIWVYRKKIVTVIVWNPDFYEE